MAQLVNALIKSKRGTLGLNRNGQYKTSRAALKPLLITSQPTQGRKLVSLNQRFN